VRHVDLLGLAPFGDDVAVVDDDAVERRADAVGAENGIERLGGRETLLMHDGLVVRRGIVARNRELDRLVQFSRVESFLLRRVLLPVETVREVRTPCGLRCDGCAERERRNGKRDEFASHGPRF
jgi:hypothetical protein